MKTSQHDGTTNAGMSVGNDDFTFDVKKYGIVFNGVFYSIRDETQCNIFIAEFKKKHGKFPTWGDGEAFVLTNM
jgi:hypothetical protein